MHLGVDLWAHQVNPIHSGTRNPGLACPKGCHSSQSKATSSHPSSPKFGVMRGGIVTTGFWRIALKWQKGPSTDIAGSSVECHPSEGGLCRHH
ncbi:hypothetical protein V8C43DRAFT_276922 [Trichoderma afarasin]